jgi:transposase
MLSFSYNKKNYPPLDKDMKKYIKDNNLKIFNNHFFRYNNNTKNKMNVISLYGDDNVNKNDYFFYDFSENEDNLEECIKKNLLEIPEIRENNLNIEKYNSEINNYKNKMVCLLSSSSILLFVTFFISYKYYLQIR